MESAKKLLVLIGTRQALRLAVGIVTAEDRNTRLRERLEDGSANTNTEDKVFLKFFVGFS